MKNKKRSNRLYKIGWDLVKTARWKRQAEFSEAIKLAANHLYYIQTW